MAGRPNRIPRRRRCTPRPYSVKVRSYFRYKAIPHRWIFAKTPDSQANTRNMPGCRSSWVVTPEGKGPFKTSTPDHRSDGRSFSGSPSILPTDTVAGLHFRLI